MEMILIILGSKIDVERAIENFFFFFFFLNEHTEAWGLNDIDHLIFLKHPNLNVIPPLSIYTFNDFRRITDNICHCKQMIILNVILVLF